MPKVLWMPWIGMIAAIIAVFFTVSDDAAWFVMIVGLMIVFAGQFIFVGFDSKENWPDVPFFLRVMRALSFYPANRQ